MTIRRTTRTFNGTNRPSVTTHFTIEFTVASSGRRFSWACDENGNIFPEVCQSPSTRAIIDGCFNGNVDGNFINPPVIVEWRFPAPE